MRDFPDLIPSRKRRSHCCLSDKSFEPHENTAKKRVPALWARLNESRENFARPSVTFPEALDNKDFLFAIRKKINLFFVHM